MQAVIAIGTSSIVKGRKADPMGITSFAPGLAPKAPPLPAKPAPKPEPQRRSPSPQRETDPPMKPFQKPASPDERPCTRPDPDTGFPTCEEWSEASASEILLGLLYFQDEAKKPPA
jgi:hypothetical protein